MEINISERQLSILIDLVDHESNSTGGGYKVSEDREHAREIFELFDRLLIYQEYYRLKAILEKEI
jgi:hypothetical protein